MRWVGLGAFCWVVLMLAYAFHLNLVGTIIGLVWLAWILDRWERRRGRV